MKSGTKTTPPATLLTLEDVFRGRLFSIPDYQRGYSWGKQQVQALHRDIELLFNSKNMHFTGTLVLTPDKQDLRNYHNKGQVFEIIDGQQRLTTIFILLHELILILPKYQQSKPYETFIARGNEGDRTDVFMLNKQIQHYFRAHIIGKERKPKDIEFFSEKRIKACKRETKNWLNSIISKKEKSPQQILQLITNQLGFIVYEPKNSSEAGMMFEVINNRGKPLSELEKVKNYLIYYAIKEKKQELRGVIDSSWGEILKNLAAAHKLQSIEENTFLRSVSITFHGLNKKQASHIYEQLKKKYPIGKEASRDDWKNLRAFVLFMKRCSSYYVALLNERSSSREILGTEIKTYIELIRSQTSHANILPIYFAVMDNKEKIEEIELIDIFKALEIINFRIYMTKNGASRSDSGQGTLYHIAHGYYSSFGQDDWWENNAKQDDKINYRNNVAVLITKLNLLTKEIIPDKSLLDGLKLEPDDIFDFYKWKGIRYFLMNYECEINNRRTIKIENILQRRKRGKSNDYYSIEHLWALKNISKKKFKNGEDSYQKRRLGNFILLELGINSQARNKGIWEKISTYSEFNSKGDKSILKQVDFLIEDYNHIKILLDKKHKKRKGVDYYYYLHKNTIDRNEERLIQFAQKRWSLDWTKKYI